MSHKFELFAGNTNGGSNRFFVDRDGDIVARGKDVSGREVVSGDPMRIGEIWGASETTFDGELSGDISDAAIEIDGDSVVLGGGEGDGEVRYRFDSADDAERFRSFLEHIQSVGFLQVLLQGKPTEFSHAYATTPGGPETLVVSYDDGKSDGLSNFTLTNDGVTQELTSVGALIEAVVEAYGGAAIRVGDFNSDLDGLAQLGKGVNARVRGDDLVIGGRGLDGRFRYDFEDAETAELAEAALEDLLDKIDRTDALAGRVVEIEDTIFDIAAANDAFDILEAALLATGLDVTLDDDSADFTVFAPTDAAFTALAQDLGVDTTGLDEAGVTAAIVATLVSLGGSEEAGLDLLKQILLYHVSTGSQTVTELQSAGAVDTVNGETIDVSDQTLVDKDPDIENPDFVEGLTNIQAANGLIQTIDRVLLPFNVGVSNPEAPTATEELGDITIAAVFDSGVGADGAEVVVQEGGFLYVTNGARGGVDVFDIAGGSTSTPSAFFDLSFLPGYDGVQSVAVKNGLLAAAVSTPNVTSSTAFGAVTEGQNGYVVLIDVAAGSIIDRVTVGNLPDMVTFNEDGTKILVANEGEFNSENGLDRDPIGSVSIIDVSNNALDPQGEIITFAAFDGLEDLARENGVRLADGASLLRGLEPEYIAVEGDVAYVALQEANAIAVLDIANGEFTSIFSLGTVDHALEGFEIDPNDDGVIAIQTFDNLVGLRMPDAIDTFNVDGATYIITANEGDGRGDAPAGDEARVGDIVSGDVTGVMIDPSVETTGLERLTISTIDGDTDGDGDIDVLHAFGSRSFTIFNDQGDVVFDSGSEFEAILADLFPERFNDDDGDDGEDRSDNKGPEPEAVTVGEIDGVVYAFIGLERDSGVMIYNINDPANATFVDYIPGFLDPAGEGPEDYVAPETIAFIPAEDSLSGAPQIAVAYEVSGDTVVYNLGDLGGGETAAPLISEFQPNPDGQDPSTVDIELSGEAGESFDYWLISVEDDGDNGVVDRAANVAGTFDANGLTVVQVADLENPSFTYILTDDFTGVEGVTDIDADNDGAVDDLSAFGEILDAVGIVDDGSEAAYADDPMLGGATIAFTGAEPELVFRDGSRGDWFAVNAPGDADVFSETGEMVDPAEFDTDPTATVDSFGAVNPTRVGPRSELQITEIWFGQDGEDLTEDWFEITNTGSVAWTANADGPLFYDDESASVADAERVNGIDSIAPGESVVVVIGDATDATAFSTVWGDDGLPSDAQVGWSDGAGLGGGGDTVTLWLDADQNGVDANDALVDAESYPDGDGASGRSWEVDAGLFASTANFADISVTTELGGAADDEPAIASPGYLPTAAPFTAIYDIQGSGAASTLEDTVVTTRGVVTAVFQGSDELGAFFVQDPDGDGDAATSDGVFVFSPATPVKVGDDITITGEVDEFFGKTQLRSVSAVEINSSGNATPAAVQIDVSDIANVDLEALEGMLVEIIDGDGSNIEVTEVFTLGRFGEFEVAPAANVQATQVLDPQSASAQDIADFSAANATNRVIINDGRGDQNPSTKVLIDDGAGGAYDPTDAAGPTLRVGAEFQSLTGALDFSFGEYQVQYDAFDDDGVYNPLPIVPGSNDRPDLPDVGGAIQVASFNVLNYFTSIDGADTTPSGAGERGADNATELARQTEKTVTAIRALNAEVVGLQEIENNGFGDGSAIDTLVDALNAAEGADLWSFVDYSSFTTPVNGVDILGSDAITTGIIYRNDAVTEVSNAALIYDEFAVGDPANTTFDLANVLNQVASSDDQVGDFQRNRPTTAATFADESGEVFTLVNSHFKSKGDSNLQDVVNDAEAHLLSGGATITQADIDALIADPNFDQGDGQGFWNATRTEAASELVAWIETDPTASNDTDVLIIGDLNAYGLESPVDVFNDAGFQHLLGGAPDDYSFTFFGEQGALDHVFASDSLVASVTGAEDWHVNADEPAFLDYNTDFEDPAFFDPTSPFRGSDHDPALIGLDFTPDTDLMVG